MYPSPDAVPDALHAVVAALVNDEAATARTHMDAIGFHRRTRRCGGRRHQGHLPRSTTATGTSVATAAGRLC